MARICQQALHLGTLCGTLHHVLSCSEHMLPTRVQDGKGARVIYYREQKLIEWSNTASVMPPRAAALHIITSPCLVNKIALTDYFIVTH